MNASLGQLWWTTCSVSRPLVGDSLVPLLVPRVCGEKVLYLTRLETQTKKSNVSKSWGRTRPKGAVKVKAASGWPRLNIWVHLFKASPYRSFSEGFVKSYSTHKINLSNIHGVC